MVKSDSGLQIIYHVNWLGFLQQLQFIAWVGNIHPPKNKSDMTYFSEITI
jgi:hypothetical protein